MAFSSNQGPRAVFPLAEKTEQTRTTQTESVLDTRRLKSLVQSTTYGTGASSIRSDTPSTTLDSVFDCTGTVYSDSTDLYVAEQCEKPSDDEDQGDNLIHSREQRDLHNAAFPDGNSPHTWPDFLRGVGKNDISKYMQADPRTSRDRPEETESDLEDDDLDSEDEDHDEDDNEWSGEPDRIETAVLANIEDLEFAAWLIVELHKDHIHSEERKIGGWQSGIINCHNSQSGESSHQSYGSSNAEKQSSRSRKRKKLSESSGRGSDDGDGDEKDDSEGNGTPENQDEVSASGDSRSKYACPFNKSDPARFCSNRDTGDQFRICESGFKTIQRLKEHVKRKHVVIQCGRCFKNFSGGRTIAEGVVELGRHLQQPVACAPGAAVPSLGINPDQLALLDRSGSKRKQKLSEVQKWFGIWDTIYPGQARPPHPWAERTTPGIKPQPASAYEKNFFDLFKKSLQHHTNSGNILFMPEQEPLMIERVISLVQKVYNVHTNLNDTPSLVNTSSSGQTETQINVPTTPGLETQNLRNIAQRQVLTPKLKKHGSQPMFMPESHASTAMDLDSQAQFSILPSQISTNMAYGSQNFPGYGGRQVPATALPGPSQPPSMQQPGFDYFMGNDWSELHYNLPADPDNQDILYMTQNQHD